MPSPSNEAEGAARAHLLVFDDPHRTLAAVQRLRAAGFEVAEVYSPFPVHGMDEALGLGETNLPWATLAGGALGCALGFGFQAWTHTASWPLDIGGKPNPGLPALVPVGFELTVLFAALFTAFALIVLGIVRARRRSDAPDVTERGVTDDRFAVLVPAAGADFPAARFRELCDELSPIELVEGRGEQ